MRFEIDYIPKFLDAEIQDVGMRNSIVLRKLMKSTKFGQR